MNAEEIFVKLGKIHYNIYHDTEKYRQFTIDTMDDIIDEILIAKQGFDSCLTIEDLIETFKYKIKSIMGICDSRLLDYKIFEEILDLLENS